MVKYLRSVGVSLAVLVLAAGAAFAAGPITQALTDTGDEPPEVIVEDEEPEADEAPSADVVALVIEKFATAGVTTTPEEVEKLAAEYGLGGAVRIISWANASGKSVDEIVAMKEAGKGWGQVAKELGLPRGNGSIMNGGHGKGHKKDNPTPGEP